MLYYRANENHFRFKDHGVIRVFYLSQISKLRLLKQRDLTLNIILLGSAMFCCSIAILISELFGSVRIISLLVSALFIVFSLEHKAYKYKLIVFTNENRIIKLKIDIIKLDDIRRQVSKINKVMRKEQDNYTFASNEMSKVPALNQ